ncbi:MAG: prephenate dehydratase [Clostridia bacterium]|nr:prephenate dehydratase [Clostridia bacterium]
MSQIVYLGPLGTFSHEAAVKWGQRTGQDSFLACSSLSEVFSAIRNRRDRVAILPVENSTEGSINLTLDLVLAEDELKVIGEVVLNISQCLVSQAKDFKQIKEVWSHPQALAQCRNYLDINLPGVALRPSASTAEAISNARYNPHMAAIGSSFAAEIYQIPIIASGIQDYKNNKTRFWVLGREPISFSGTYKTSLVVAAPANRPGSLYNILRYFAEADINLTRIESRPTKKELGEYLFFIDCEGKSMEPPLRDVLESLKSSTVLLKVLGTYPQDKGWKYEFK